MIIYKTTCLVNNRIYIGQSIYNNPSYLGSGAYYKRAEKKYGKECFVKEILEYCDTQDELDERETYWIKHLNSQDPTIGYNIANGGSGGTNTITWHPEKERICRQISKSLTGYKQSRAHIDAVSLSLANRSEFKKMQWRTSISNSMTSRLLTDDHKEHISIALLGHIVKRETKDKISKTLAGYTHTEKAKENMRAAQNKKYAAGYTLTQASRKLISINKLGIACKQETKDKISKANKGRRLTAEHKEKQSRALKGKPKSKTHKENLSKSAKNRQISDIRKLTLGRKQSVVINDVQYDSFNVAGKALRISASTVANRVRSNRSEYTNWSFIAI